MPAKIGFVKQAVRGGVDFTLIHPCGDNGTVQREEELMGRNREEEGMLLRVKVPVPTDRFNSTPELKKDLSESDLPLSNDFRHGIDESECKCDGNTVCVTCCTARDLADVPKSSLEHIKMENHRPKAVGDALETVFDVIMPRQVAENIGLLPEGI